VADGLKKNEAKRPEVKFEPFMHCGVQAHHTIPTKPWPLNGTNHPLVALTGSEKSLPDWPNREYSMKVF